MRYRVYSDNSMSHYIWTESKAKVIKDKECKTIFLQRTCQDVTENELAKNKISEISNKLSNVLDL